MNRIDNCIGPGYLDRTNLEVGHIPIHPIDIVVKSLASES